MPNVWLRPNCAARLVRAIISAVEAAARKSKIKERNSLNLLLRILPPVLFVGAYIGAVWYWVYALDNHPWIMISIIAIGGLPLGYIALRVSQNEEQRRSLWSTTQTYVKSDASVVPEPDQAAKVFGAGSIDNVPFRVLSIYAAVGGIRLERTFRAIGPIVIGWDHVQRLDLLRFPEKGKTPAHNGALISLKSVDRDIVLIPWPDHFHEFVPDNIGQRTHAFTD